MKNEEDLNMARYLVRQDKPTLIIAMVVLVSLMATMAEESPELEKGFQEILTTNKGAQPIFQQGEKCALQALDIELKERRAARPAEGVR